jgi:tetratricopeptide (TPR) repeat protein
MTTSTATDFDPYERIALARNALEKADFATALSYIKPTLQQNGVPDEALVIGGAIYSSLRLFDRAEKLFQRFVEKNPKAAGERLQLGVIQAQLGKAKEAMSAWEQVLKENPDFFPASLYKGMALLQQGSVTEARECLDLVLRTAPANSTFFGQARDLLQAIGGRPGGKSQAKAEMPKSGTIPIPETYRKTKN